MILYLKKISPIFNNFELILATFMEAFGEHDKIHWATTKIYFCDKDHSVHLYALKFKKLACVINWDGKAIL